MVDNDLIVSSCNGGWAIARQEKDGSIIFLSFPWETKKEAQAFLAIARPSLDFIPSRLIEAP